MAQKWQIVILSVILYGSVCMATAVSKQATPRQGAAGAVAGGSLLSTIGALVPGVVSNMLPLVLLFGLGALMVPALGLGLLLREGRRRSFPSFNINTSAIMDGVHDVFEKVMKALDNVDKKYN